MAALGPLLPPMASDGTRSGAPANLDLLSIDIGGTLYRSTRQTLSGAQYFIEFFDWLTNAPSCSLSNSTSEFNFDHAQNTLFIDREGNIFSYLLIYLRSGNVAFLQDEMYKDLALLKAIRHEAAFFGMPKLEQLVAAHMATMDRVIILSVGGIEHQVTANTLRRAPESSILVQLANNPESLPYDNRGRPFIDRDGLLFSLIIEWLRTGEITNLPCSAVDRVTLARLEREARFYHLEEFIDALYTKLHPWRSIYIRNEEDRMEYRERKLEEKRAKQNRKEARRHSDNQRGAFQGLSQSAVRRLRSLARLPQRLGTLFRFDNKLRTRSKSVCDMPQEHASAPVEIIEDTNANEDPDQEYMVQVMPSDDDGDNESHWPDAPTRTLTADQVVIDSSPTRLAIVETSH